MIEVAGKRQVRQIDCVRSLAWRWQRNSVRPAVPESARDFDWNKAVERVSADELVFNATTQWRQVGTRCDEAMELDSINLQNHLM